MLRGRKPKPQAVKDLEGNPGKRPANENAPKLPTLSQVPPAPEYLGVIAAAKWVEVAGMLVVANVLTGGDLHNLEAFCVAYQTFREAEADIVKNGLTTGSKRKGFRKNPSVTIRAEAMRQLRDFSALLGLDPSSRERLKVPKIGTQPPSATNRFTALPGGMAAKGAA